MNRTATLNRVDRPDIEIPGTEPEIPASIYLDRIDRLKGVATDAGYEIIVVYGDREHSANLRYLTGYDPRFEEALLILDANGDAPPLLLAGNEGYGYAEGCPVRSAIEVELYQSLSLLGQDRTRSRSIEEILADCGVRSGSRVGTVGWKYFLPEEMTPHETALEIPSYLADVLRRLTGSDTSVLNATGLLMDASTGLRIECEIDQLASIEYGGAMASRAVRNVVQGIAVGMSEHGAAELMSLNGLPLSCHPMLSAGKRAWLGMGSPSSRPIERGDAFTTAVGVWGGLTSRAGFVVESADELEVPDYVDRLVGPYFETIVAWYEQVGIGVLGGELFEIVDSRIGDEFFGVGLNPGHQIHLDEWVNSPIYKGSTEEIRSGMALQVDVIPATGGPYYTSNIEDGILVADGPAREEFASRFPEAWKRIESRRDYMREVIGITLKPEILPTSSIPAWLPPYLLDTSKAMTVPGRK